MTKKKAEEKGLIAQLKKAIRSSDKTLYRVAKESGVGLSPLYRFMAGERGLNIQAVEKLCDALDLQLTPVPPKEPGQPDQPEPTEPPESPVKKRRPRKEK